MKPVLRTALALAIGIALYSSQSVAEDKRTPAEDNQSVARVIQAYASGCKMHQEAGHVILRMALFVKPEDAAAAAAETASSEAESPKPQTEVLVDVDAGIVVTQLNKQSLVRLLCAAVKSVAGKETITVQTNAQNILTRVRVMGQIINSDAFALMTEPEQARIDSVVSAFLEQGLELFNLQRLIQGGELESDPSEGQPQAPQRQPGILHTSL